MDMSIGNLKGTGPLKFNVEHDGKLVTLVIGSTVNRENKVRKGGMGSIRQFEPILVYLHRRGLEDKVFKIYESINERFSPSIGGMEENVCQIITNELLALLDFEDICKFVVDDLGREPLSSLPDTFSDSILKTGFGAMKQTYLKHEYIELCALITMFKIILPPLAHYQYLKSNTSKDKAAFDAFTYIKDTVIFNLPPMIKLTGLIEVLKERIPANDIQVTLSKNVDTDSIVEMLVATLSFTKLFTASFLEDNNDKQIVKVLHGKAKKMLGPKATNMRIGLETKINSNDTNAPSIIENIRVGTTLSLGDIEEFNFVFTSRDYLKHIFGHMGMVLDEQQFNSIHKLTKVYENVELTSLSKNICAWLFDIRFGIINSDALVHLRVEANRIMITIGIIYFLNRGELLNVMLISAYKHSGYSNTNEDKSTLQSDIAKELAELMYGDNDARKAINTLSKEAMVHLYVQVVPDKYIYNDRVTALPRTIRNDLSRLYIDMFKGE